MIRNLNKKPKWHSLIGKPHIKEPFSEAANKYSEYTDLYEIPFGQPSNRKTYTKLYCAISNAQFQDNLNAGFYNYSTEGMMLVELSDMIKGPADPTEFLGRLQRVGQLYAWDKREHFHDTKVMSDFVSDPETRMWALLVGGVEVGFAMTKGQKLEGNGISKQEAVNIFCDKHKLKPDPKFIEFFKFGLYPEFTKNKFGSVFFTSVLQNLFKNYDVVIFDTRDNNHKGVPNFYKKLKIDAFYAEDLPSDLIKEPEVNYEPVDYVGKTNFVSTFNYAVVQQEINGTSNKPIHGVTKVIDALQKKCG